MKKNKILAISGGPDSMVLLYMNRNKKNIIVCHVNYNIRKDSKIDESIVKNFCKKHNMIFKSLNLEGNKPKQNFQAWARKVRYDFFQKIYKKHDGYKLLMGHHKDDFLETAEMQVRSKRTPKFFGIKSKNKIMGMNICRPFITTYWKEELINFAKDKNIPYQIDASNFESIYERNKIRLEINKWSKRKKESRIKWYKMSNKILKKKWNKIDYLYRKWDKSAFSSSFIMTTPYKIELIFEFINKNYKNVALSKNKMKNIIDFICSENKDGTYLLNSENKLIKINNKLKTNLK